MHKPGFTRRELPLALAGGLGASAAVFAQGQKAPDEKESHDQNDVRYDPVVLQLLVLEQRYELTEDDRAAIVPRLHRQRLRSEVLKNYPLSSAAEPATVFQASPDRMYGGADANQ